LRDVAFDKLKATFAAECEAKSPEFRGSDRARGDVAQATPKAKKSRSPE